MWSHLTWSFHHIMGPNRCEKRWCVKPKPKCSARQRRKSEQYTALSHKPHWLSLYSQSARITALPGWSQCAAGVSLLWERKWAQTETWPLANSLLNLTCMQKNIHPLCKFLKAYFALHLRTCRQCLKDNYALTEKLYQSQYETPNSSFKLWSSLPHADCSGEHKHLIKKKRLRVPAWLSRPLLSKWFPMMQTVLLLGAVIWARLVNSTQLTVSSCRKA